MAMHRKMHLVLYGLEEKPRRFCVFIIIKRGCVQICDFLVKLALRQTNFPNLL